MQRLFRQFTLFAVVPFTLSFFLIGLLVLADRNSPANYSNQTPVTNETTTEVTPNNEVPTQPKYVQQPIETDPVITCTSNECGSRQLSRSACEASMCCGVGGEWVWTESQSLCYQMQSDEKRKADELKQKQYEFDVAEAEQENKEYEQEQDKLKQECSSRATQQYLDCNNNCNTNPYTGCTDSCKSWYDTSMTTCK